VGSSSFSDSSHAFRWTASDNTMRDIDTAGSNGSAAMGVNADGSVVVGQRAIGGGSYAFRWIASDNIMHDLGTLGGTYSWANGVNADGSIVVGASRINSSDPYYHAFRWTASDSIMHDLDTLGGNYSAANGVNADGSVVVGQSTLTGDTSSHAFRWTASDNAMHDLGTLGSGSASRAYGVNADGSVVVGESEIEDDGFIHAFRWTASDNAMRDLNTLGGNNSRAYGVNADGSVVVGQSNTSSNGDNRAFRWTPTGGMQSVEQWLTNNGVAVGDIHTDAAYGVNADGNVVVGQLSDNDEAFIARVMPTTPTPTPTPGSGLITLNDVADSLSSSSTGMTAALDAPGLMMNGAHSHPLSRRVEKGRKTVWVAGDWGKDRHAGRDGDVGLHEIGVGYNFGKAQVNVSLGKTRNTQKTVLGGSTTNKGDYAMVEAIVPLSEKHKVYATVGAYQHKGDMDSRRAYLNAGLPDSSNGKANTKTKGVRVRVDWEDAAKVGKTSLTPYADFSQSKAHMDGFTETGGGFPARFDARDEKATEARIGVNGSTDLNGKVKLLTNLEAAHRFEKKGAATSGNLVGLFGFNLDGKAVKRDWLKAGVGLEGKVGKNGKASLMVNATTNSNMPKTWVAASYQIDF
jgi:probable HAF family extracellular repeat protein